LPAASAMAAGDVAQRDAVSSEDGLTTQHHPILSNAQERPRPRRLPAQCCGACS
jgi:hypothetical protein